MLIWLLQRLKTVNVSLVKAFKSYKLDKILHFKYFAL
jgi:hypothetical protein